MSIGVAEVLQKGSINSINTTHFAESPTTCSASKSTSSVDYLSMLAGELTFDQKETLLKVFEDFSDIFDDSRKPQATRNTLKHRINTEQHPPVSQGAYRVSATERQIIREEFCHKAQPLQELLKNNSKFVWGPEQETSFQKLKDVLIHDPVLGLYDGNAPIELHTDASGYGLGAVLVQIQDCKEKSLRSIGDLSANRLIAIDWGYQYRLRYKYGSIDYQVDEPFCMIEFKRKVK
ncbi:hypothetical protein JTE90_014480 [Oedothorax gibbosus]|uniref:Reverse transcriptase/retrotransposon-derived protein RNase H-like domain-containing protein n=1 Tax=Oedothorax gibbosus TaxID=931172 RepID=A0AAV6VJK3_9ARAC|nr:hypothetical protein JTE90_014480 [Oedothorax gibbosus]